MADPCVFFGPSIKRSTLYSRNAPGRCNGDGCCESSLHDASLAPAERRGNRGCKKAIIERYGSVVLTYVDGCIILARKSSITGVFGRACIIRHAKSESNISPRDTLRYTAAELQLSRDNAGPERKCGGNLTHVLECISPRDTLWYTAAALNATRNFLRQNVAYGECVAFVQLLLSRDNAGPERKRDCNFGHLADCLSFAFILDQSSTFMHFMSEST